jgi:hypothetical protein
MYGVAKYIVLNKFLSLYIKFWNNPTLIYSVIRDHNDIKNWILVIIAIIIKTIK